MSENPLKCPECGISWESENDVGEDLFNNYPDFFTSARNAQVYAKLKLGWSVDNPWRFFDNVDPIANKETNKIEALRCLNCNHIYQTH